MGQPLWEMDLTQFETPEALQEWIDEQDDPDEIEEELGELIQENTDQPSPHKYMAYKALALRDVFPMSGAIQPETLEKKWDVYDEDGERNYGDDDYEAVAAVCNDVKEAFLAMTGVVAGGSDKEGDTEIDFDEEGKISEMEDWWINDDRGGNWMVVIDEFPYFNFEPR